MYLFTSAKLHVEYDKYITAILRNHYITRNIFINSSLKFEIKAKQFYAASQRVL